MSLRSMLERSRDALLAVAGVGAGAGINVAASASEHVDQGLLDHLPSEGWGSLIGLGGGGGGHGHASHGYGLADLRNLFFWLVMAAILTLFAVITNPNETSFRSHLTELSFRRHLADIRRSETDEPLSDEHAQLPSSTPSHATPDKHGHNGTLTAPASGAATPTHTIAPFRFANHVAISLRTPTLLYRSFLVLSIAITSPLAAPTFLSDPTATGLSKLKHPLAHIKERHVIWIGFMGHWTLVGLVPSSVEWVWKVLTRAEREKGRKKGSNLDKAGILEMRAVQNKEEPASTAKALLAPTQSTPKNLRRSDSTSNIHDSPSVHSTNASGNLAPATAESRRPSLANLMAQPTAAAVADSPETASSPVLSSLKAELAAAQSVLTDLQSQLSAHEQSVSDAHAHLQTSLDELRTRRKEDDAERQELKAKTKSFEEQKRQAEAARREAEKKLKTAETVRDGLELKIAAAENEVRGFRSNMENSERNVRVLQEEGAKHVVETQQAVDEKKDEVARIEDAIADLERKGEELAGQVKEAEDRLKAIVEAGEAAKRLGPEEEMMLMAAAYEAAAQEGYHQGYQHTHGGGNQWASQAAAYMAEAGMPHLGYDYTARPNPTNSSSTTGTTGFGHLSRHPNSTSHRDLNDLRKIADVSGFEDFGPGASGVASAMGLKKLSTPPQPASDSESDIYGHDPGSPNGGISSSFSANLLPQGLFRSLEGDQTPLVGADDDLPVTFAEPLHLDESDAGEQAGDSGSDSGDEDIWRSPMPEPGTLVPSNSTSKRLSGSYSNRLMPPSNPSQSTSSLSPSLNPGMTTPPAIPGIPALPAVQGSRRWFSGTLSSDNIPNTFGFHPSSDSLPLIGGGAYESPFAPTSSEKKALAAKWAAPFSKRWAASTSSSNTGVAGSAGSGSASAGNAESPFDSTESTSGWPIGNGHSRNGSGRLSSSPTTATAGSIGNGRPSSLLGSSYDSTESRSERKPFRFFSLRKPGSGTSPNRERSGTSPSSS